jgi:hypothetical protein
MSIEGCQKCMCGFSKCWNGFKTYSKNNQRI